MSGTAALLILNGLFAAVAGLFLSGDRRAPPGPLRRSAPLRTALRLFAVGVLCLSLWVVAEISGWEIGIPIWLGLLSAAAIGNLYLAAVAPRAQRIAAAATTTVSAIAAAGAMFTAAA